MTKIKSAIVGVLALAALAGVASVQAQMKDCYRQPGYDGEPMWCCKQPLGPPKCVYL